MNNRITKLPLARVTEREIPICYDLQKSSVLIVAFALYIICTIDTCAYAVPYSDYSSYGIDMTIKYPDNWVYQDYTDDSTYFIPSKEVSFLSNLTASPDVYVRIGEEWDLPYKNMALDLYFDYEKKLRINQGFIITNTGKTNLSDGRPAYEIDFVTNNTAHPQKSILVLMNNNPESYYFVYTAPSDKFNTYLPVAQEMYKTLSFKR